MQMYKVFLNEKPLILTTSMLVNSELTPLIHSKFSDTQIIIKALKSKKQIVYTTTILILKSL